MLHRLRKSPLISISSTRSHDSGSPGYLAPNCTMTVNHEKMSISVRSFSTLTFVNYPTIQRHTQINNKQKFGLQTTTPSRKIPITSMSANGLSTVLATMNAKCDMSYQIYTGTSDVEFSLLSQL